MVSRRFTPQVTLYEPHIAQESLTGTARFCLAMQAKRGNSCTCCVHHIRGSVSRGTYCTLVQGIGVHSVRGRWTSFAKFQILSTINYRLCTINNLLVRALTYQ